MHASYLTLVGFRRGKTLCGRRKRTNNMVDGTRPNRDNEITCPKCAEEYKERWQNLLALKRGELSTKEFIKRSREAKHTTYYWEWLKGGKQG